MGAHLLGVFGPDFVTRLVSSFFCPLAFVFAGGKTAPAHQFFTGIALLVLVIVVGTVFLTLKLAGVYESPIDMGWVIVCDVITVGAGVFACAGLHEEESLGV